MSDASYIAPAHPVDPAIIIEVRESFNRAVTSNRLFFQEFYDELLGKREEFRIMFGETERVHQYARLYAGIQKLFEFAENPRSDTLMLTGSVHSRKYISVKPEYYMYWIDSLLATVRRSDSLFTTKLAGQWMTVILPGVEFLKSRY